MKTIIEKLQAKGDDIEHHKQIGYWLVFDETIKGEEAANA